MLDLSSMDFSRIAIFGGSGSGKSFLSEKLGYMLDVQPTHLDDLYHGPNWTFLPKKQLVKQVSKILRRDKWIIDGNYTAVRSQVLRKCTFIIMIKIPLIYQLKQLILRSIGRNSFFKVGPITNLPKEVIKSNTKENLAEALFVLTKSAINFYHKKSKIILKEIARVCHSQTLIILSSNGQRDNFLSALKYIFENK